MNPDPNNLNGAKPSEPVDGVYQGTVRLLVEGSDSVRQLIKFVEALRTTPEFRILRLVGSYEEQVGIWLGLRTPSPLKDVLLRIAGVTQVEPTQWRQQGSDEPVLIVRLSGPTSSS